MNGQAHKVQHLEQAFQTFNSLSEQLITSYQQLEAQVEQLNADLDIARDQRLQQFDETKRLANRLERLLDALPGGVVVLDGKGVVCETNPAAVELLGEPLKGIPWRNIIKRAFAPQFDDGHEVSLKDGRKVSIATSSLGDDPGQILLLKDISDTRELQDKLSRYQRLSAMGQMAASLAHQIRTPTASALLYVSNLCRNDVDSVSVQKYGEKIREQLRHIESMISEMLSYAKGGDDFGCNQFCITDIAQQLGHAAYSIAGSKGCELKIINEAAEACLIGSKDALLGALLNLVTNAINASEVNTGKVVVRFYLFGDDLLRITIADNGCGIPDDMKQHIFEPFMTTRPQGTGLGLAIVKSVIEKLNGEITFKSQIEQGTEFKVALPIYIENKLDKDEEQDTQLKEVWL